MTHLMLGRGSELTLPDAVCSRYGLTPDTPTRIIETRSGILLVPQTDAPMSEELERELEEWQSLGAEPGTIFSHEE